MDVALRFFTVDDLADDDEDQEAHEDSWRVESGKEGEEKTDEHSSIANEFPNASAAEPVLEGGEGVFEEANAEESDGE